MAQKTPTGEDMTQMVGKDYNAISIENRVNRIIYTQPIIPREAAYEAVTAVKTSFNDDRIEAQAIAIAAKRLGTDPKSWEAAAVTIVNGDNPFTNAGVQKGLHDAAIGDIRALLTASGVKNPQQSDLDQIMAKATEVAKSQANGCQ